MIEISKNKCQPGLCQMLFYAWEITKKCLLGTAKKKEFLANTGHRNNAFLTSPHCDYADVDASL